MKKRTRFWVRRENSRTWHQCDVSTVNVHNSGDEARVDSVFVSADEGFTFLDN